MDYDDADTPLARYLRSRIGDVPLNEIERRSKKNGSPILASSLSSWLHAEVLPGRRSILRIAAFFGDDPADVARIVQSTAPPAASPEIASNLKGQAAGGSGSLPARFEDDVVERLAGRLAHLFPAVRPAHFHEDEFLRYVKPFVVDEVEDAAMVGGVVEGMGGGQPGLGERKLFWKVRLSGRCMEPAIPDGGEVIVERAYGLIGDTVAVAIGDDVICKRLAIVDGETVLIADDGTIVRPGEDGRIIGVVRFVPMPKRSAVAAPAG